VQSLAIDILDNKGQVVRSIPGAAPGGGRGRAGSTEGGLGAEAAAAGGEEGASGQGRGGRGGGPATAPIVPGLNRVMWDLQYASATSFPGMVLWGAATGGPNALPGSYRVRLTVDGRAQTQPLTLKKHPLHNVSDADLQEQFDLAMQIREKVTEANNAVIQIRKVKQQVAESLAKTSDGDLKAAGGRLARNLSTIEDEVYQVRNQSNQDPLNFPIRINNRLASLLRVVNTGDGKPIGNAYSIFKDLSQELKVQADRLRQTLDADLPAFNRLATRLGLDAVNEK